MAVQRRRGGKPRRVPDEPASQPLVIRLTPSEYQRLREATDASGERYMSDFVRTAIKQRAARFGVKP